MRVLIIVGVAFSLCMFYYFVGRFAGFNRLPSG